MIIAVDIETNGLDCTKYLTAVLIKETNPRPEIYRKKEDLWNRIIQLGKQEQKRGKVLNVYAHYHKYDFYGYADLKDKNIHWFSQDPFIVAYRQPRLDNPNKKQEIIKFLDTWAIFKTNLKTLGETIGLPKMEMPKELEGEKEKITEEELKEIETYCIRDVEIVMKSIKEIKKKIKEQGASIKRLYTINQIAINHMLTKLSKIGTPKKVNGKWIIDNDFLFWDKNKRETRRTFRAKEIHGAYRGGRVQCFKTGIIERATSKDCNSRYPTSACEIEFPDLRTERKTWRPLETKTIEGAIKGIGISRTMLKNNKCNIGVIPIRTGTGNYFPKKGKYMIGTYTHMELREAVKRGYEIIEIEWQVTWKEARINPLRQYMQEEYKMKKEAKTPLDYKYHKDMMNTGLGKLAQTRVGQEIVIDSVEKAEEYVEKNWKIIKGVGLDYMYKQEETKAEPKKYYTPVIPTLINAHSRVEMYKMMKKIPEEDLIYTDTDNIIYKGNHDDKFEIGKEMGQYKDEFRDKQMIIYGKKTYMIGETIKISGIKRKHITAEQFRKGEVEDKKMITMNTTNDIGQVGKFRVEKRNLNRQLEEHNEQERIMEEQELYIDKDITDINYFITKINEVLPSITEDRNI